MFKSRVFKDKEIIRILAIVFISIALFIETGEIIHEIALKEATAVTIGFYGFSLFLVGFLIVALALKKVRLAIFLLGNLKLFDCVAYSQLFFRKLPKVQDNTLLTTVIILFGVTAFVLFVSFVFFILEKAFDMEWADKGIKICLFTSSIIMFICGIINFFYVHYYTYHYIQVFEPFAGSLLYLGLFFGAFYDDEEKENENKKSIA